MRKLWYFREMLNEKGAPLGVVRSSSRLWSVYTCKMHIELKSIISCLLAEPLRQVFHPVPVALDENESCSNISTQGASLLDHGHLLFAAWSTTKPRTSLIPSSESFSAIDGRLGSASAAPLRADEGIPLLVRPPVSARPALGDEDEAGLLNACATVTTPRRAMRIIVLAISRGLLR